MPKKRKFCPYSKPFKPSPPRKTIVEPSVISVEEVGNYDKCSIPEGAVEMYLNVDTKMEYGDIITDITITFYRVPKEIPNPNYDAEYAEYKESLKSYRQELKEWNVEKKLYDQAEKESKIAFYKKELERLERNNS